ncbi:MAG: PilZ domain-containing protein [Candidatus Omnitrophica bacterium]|nr:PilZ domain-containing protein [Candidatus Omnitrophota bacterium]
MQERRTTIRVPHQSHIQYCPSEDLLPRDGGLIDLSERGVGLLTSESHPTGEAITITLSLPGAEDSVTATGVVRWSAAPAGPWTRHRVGLEWTPLAHTTQQRLHAFLSTATRATTQSFGLWQVIRQEWARHRLGLIVGIVGGAVFLIAGGWWMYGLREENRQLQMAIRQRSETIHQLAQRDAVLQQELRLAKTRLASTSEEVARLDYEAQQMERGMQQLTHDVARFQQSYGPIKEERHRLAQQVLSLEQQRANSPSLFVSSHELRRVVRETLVAHRQARRQLRLKEFRAIEPQRASARNGGYVVRDGQPTTNTSTMWIRVHDPESLPSAP